MATDKPRFSVTFTDDSYKKIKKYQMDNDISTQSKAVARLVEIAINEIESESDKESLRLREPTLSDILTSIGQQYGSNARKAFSMYVQLDERDQGEICGEMRQMLKGDKYHNSPCIKKLPPEAV